MPKHSFSSPQFRYHLRSSIGVATFVVIAGVGILADGAAASCASGALSTWPPRGAEIPQNAAVVVTGYGDRADSAAGLERYRPHLLSKSHFVELQVTSRYDNGHRYMRETQVVLSSSERLLPGRQYTLVLLADESDVETRFKRFRPVGGSVQIVSAFDDVVAIAVLDDEDQMFRWTASGAVDDRAPSWRRAPQQVGGEYRKLSCGPSNHALISVDVDEPVQLDVVLTDSVGKLRSFRKSTDDDGHLLIGHGMCSRTFDVKPGATYTAELTPIDKAGNRGPTSEPMQVVMPEPGMRKPR